MKVLNYTPHDVTFVTPEGEILKTIPSSGCARLSQKSVMVETIQMDGLEIPVYAQEFGKVEGLPAESEDTILIVSRIVAEALKDRKDLRCPGRGIKGADGRPIGCVGLSRI